MRLHHVIESFGRDERYEVMCEVEGNSVHELADALRNPFLAVVRLPVFKSLELMTDFMDYGAEILAGRVYGLPSWWTYAEVTVSSRSSFGLLVGTAPGSDRITAHSFARPHDGARVKLAGHIWRHESQVGDDKWYYARPHPMAEGVTFECMRENAAAMDRSVRILLGLLNTQGVARDVVKPDAKLNKARERRGKPAIRSEIVLRIPQVKVRSHGDGERASPIPHFRRGHTRNWKGQKIPVSPCLVLGGAPAKPYRVELNAPCKSDT